MFASRFLSAALLLSFLRIVLAGLPKKIYGVNLGSWLLLEPWMLPAGWLAMGGEMCSDCSTCIASESAFAEAYPEKKVSAEFNKHWTTWFNQDDVNELASLGINTVRIPLGYWIIEQLVDKGEFFPKGGLKHLRRGLRQLHDAGIVAILDHHALPGVQTAQQMFTGRCTRDVEFYTDYNYHRALVWTAVMTGLAHLDPMFKGAVSIQAVNEPIMDATLTPGYGEFQKNFVLTVRAVEALLGIGDHDGFPHFSSTNFTTVLIEASTTEDFNPEVQDALAAAGPILLQIAAEFNIQPVFNVHAQDSGQREPLTTNFMDINWQFNDPPNPADATLGPQGYDNHLYYSFGGVADPNPDAYLQSICNLRRVENDAALGNSPLWFGEWALSTQFDASDDFLRDWADAQKLAYSKGQGWIFWSFKIEISPEAGDTARQWSYTEGVKRGYLTRKPAELHNPHVCDDFVEQ
ncbi:glycosyl hydrolase 5 (cellulase A) family protein [Pleurotus pulmonarius]